MPAAAVRGWWPGGKRRRGRNEPRTGTRRTGVARWPGSATRRRGCCLVGLAPAAHGGNRTGRVFTGDRSGDFLFGALHRAGFASQAESRQRDDGLELHDAFVTAIVRCAPPANKPSANERTECRQWLEAELDLLPRARVAVALGGEAWRQLLRVFRERGLAVPRPAPRFGHGVEAEVGEWTLLGAYHPSQQNTFTGRLTPAMLDAVLDRARELAADST